MGREAESRASRLLVTSSNQYGITTGGYTAEHLELTPQGSIATAEGAPEKDRLKAYFELAIEQNEWFHSLYTKFKDGRLPTLNVLHDHLTSAGLEAEYASECVETFTVNAKFISLLRPMAGAERLLSIEHAIEDFASPSLDQDTATTKADVVRVALSVPAAPEVLRPPANDTEDFSRICFYISPIGEEESEQRMHADLFMGALIEPALAELDLKLVGADKIGKVGLINAQVIEYIARSPLVVADLSFHNPNVFYEIALRHAIKKPLVQLIRKSDKVPFDLNQSRTVEIDTTNIYTLVPRLETYRAEIATQMRMALDSGGGENPLTAFYPAFWSDLYASRVK
jgi:hypothetical protein